MEFHQWNRNRKLVRRCDRRVFGRPRKSNQASLPFAIGILSIQCFEGKEKKNQGKYKKYDKVIFAWEKWRAWIPNLQKERKYAFRTFYFVEYVRGVRASISEQEEKSKRKEKKINSKRKIKWFTYCSISIAICRWISHAISLLKWLKLSTGTLRRALPTLPKNTFVQSDKDDASQKRIYIQFFLLLCL